MRNTRMNYSTTKSPDLIQDSVLLFDVASTSPSVILAKFASHFVKDRAPRSRSISQDQNIGDEDDRVASVDSQ